MPLSFPTACVANSSETNKHNSYETRKMCRCLLLSVSWCVWRLAAEYRIAAECKSLHQANINLGIKQRSEVMSSIYWRPPVKQMWLPSYVISRPWCETLRFGRMSRTNQSKDLQSIWGDVPESWHSTHLNHNKKLLTSPRSWHTIHLVGKTRQEHAQLWRALKM